MIKKNLLALLCLGLTFQLAFSQIITQSDPHAANKSTDFLRVGNLRIGITSRAGGAINSFLIPDAANSNNLIDIMGKEAEGYGRLGQSAIRDEAHSGVYNPTQAGFWEEWGTPRTVQRLNLDGSSNTTSTQKLLNVVSNPASLWYGDGKYDFIYNQSIVKDYYNFRNFTGDFTDKDNIDEGSRNINQSEEITSEFNYGGTYEDFQGRLGSNASAVLHHFEYAFKRNPTDNGNRNPPFSAMQQFTEAGGGFLTDYTPPPATQGNKVYQASFLRTLNVGLGVTAFEGTDKDLNSVIAKWVMRWDDALFDPLYRYKQRLDGTWSAAENRTNNGFTGNAGNGYKTSVIVSYIGNKDLPGRSIGFYRPSSRDNNSSIVAKSVVNNSVVYRVNRQTEISVFDQKNTFKIGMSATGFDHRIKGILNPTRLTNYGNVTGRDVYENYVADYFIFYGDTPQEVMTAIAKVDYYLISNNNILSTQVASENVASSIDVVNTISLSIFPNPATTLINIKLTNPKATNVNIFNQVGKLVYTKQNVAGNFSIPSAEIGGAGVYFIKTETETKQFIIAQ